MGTIRPKTQEKYDAIRKAFKKMADKKYKGIQIYTNDYIFIKLAERFFLSANTIENIVFFRVGFRGE